MLELRPINAQIAVPATFECIPLLQCIIYSPIGRLNEVTKPWDIMESLAESELLHEAARRISHFINLPNFIHSVMLLRACPETSHTLHDDCKCH
jgi:hypothetical protein